MLAVAAWPGDGVVARVIQTPASFRSTFVDR